MTVCLQSSWKQFCLQTFGSTTPSPVEGFLIALGKFLKVIAPRWHPAHISHVGAGIDSSLSDNFGRSIVGAFSVITTFLTISVVGGPQFLLFIIFIGSLYWNGEWLVDAPLPVFWIFPPKSFESKLQWYTLIHRKEMTHHPKQVYGQTSRDLRRLGMSP